MRKFLGLIVVFLFSLFMFSSISVNTNMYNSKYQNYALKNILKKQSDITKNWSEKKKRIKGVVKFDEPNKFFELHKMIRTQEGFEKPNYKMNYRLEELSKAKKELLKLGKTTSVSEITWVERGPANVGGRTRGLLVDPDDPNKETWFTCAVGGGVWKTTDAGATWELKTTDLPNIAMSYIAMAASNHNIIYVGTGEGFGNLDGIYGNGIFKSTDKGETWAQLASTANNTNFAYVNRIIVDPLDENIVIAATRAGIFKSTDGGITWAQTYSGSRIQDLIINPLNNNSIYATKNGGPVLKSLDGGETWLEINEGVVGGRLEIDIAPTDTNRLYISSDPGTLLMSTDAGLSWEKVEVKTGDDIDWHNGQGWYDNAIAVHPYNENIVFFAGIDVWKAEIVFDSVKGISSVEENGTDSFMAFKDDKLSYLNGGLGTGEEYFDSVLVIGDDYVNVEIRFGNNKSQKAYMFTNYKTYKSIIDVPFEVWDVTNNKQLMVAYNDIRKNNKYDWSITRGDEIFVLAVDYDSVNTNNNIATDGGLKYKNLYVVSPKNATGSTWDPTTHPESNLRIIAGYVPVSFRNTQPITDGYHQYQDKFPGTSTAPHVDQHELVMIPINETTGEFRILNANDGGVAYSSDGGVTWVETDQNGYNTSQFYGADKRPGANEYFGGMQDNGSWQSPNGEDASASTLYNFRIGGDGYETSWHYKDPNKLIGGSQYNRFRKSIDGGATFYAANNGFTGWGNPSVSPFVSKIAKTNSDPDLLFTITRQGVWRTDDFAERWELSPINNLDGGGQYFSMAQVAISIANPQIVWAASYLNTTTTPNISMDGGFTFSPVNGYPEVTMGRLSGLDTHPTDEATAYLIFSFSGAPKILRTTNYGQTWEDITGFGTGNVSVNGFPDVAVYCVAVMPYNTDIIWAGTDIGIVESTDNGVSWHLLGGSFPAVSVWEIKIVDDQAVVATHGRGIWSATIPKLSGYTPPVVTLSPRINGDVEFTGSTIVINASLRSVYDSTRVYANDQVLATILNNEVIDTTINLNSTISGSINIKLVSYKDSKTFRSSSQTVQVFSFNSAALGYATTFDGLETDFLTNGFKVSEETGFDNGALHSDHPYLEAPGATDNYDTTNFTALLLTPIIVANSDAILTYDDVAIVEKADPGKVFGDFEFWDYVIVEASKDTSNWVKLLNGYDATFNSAWLTAYDNEQAGNSSMFVNHSIDLLDFFSPGDTIFIRFRLFSDELAVGWGWVIDNLSIQGNLVGIKDNSIIPIKYSLNQNYPNPFNPSTTISFSIPQKSNVSIKIYNSIGQLVKTLYNKVTEVGNYKINWDANVSSGVYYYTIKAGNFVDTKKMVFLK